jgi:hypothetical protein
MGDGGRDYAAITVAQIAGIVSGRPGSFPTLNGTDSLLHAPMILLDSVIEILARTDPDVLRHLSFCLQFPDRPMGSRVCIQRDDPRRSVPVHRLLKETFGCSNIPLCGQQKSTVRPCLSTAR